MSVTSVSSVLSPSSCLSFVLVTSVSSVLSSSSCLSFVLVTSVSSVLSSSSCLSFVSVTSVSSVLSSSSCLSFVSVTSVSSTTLSFVLHALFPSVLSCPNNVVTCCLHRSSETIFFLVSTSLGCWKVPTEVISPGPVWYKHIGTIVNRTYVNTNWKVLRPQSIHSTPWAKIFSIRTDQGQ